jgi:hypothetical protein
MRNSTKIRQLIASNNLLLSDGGNKNIDIIITNKQSGNSHMVTGKNLTEALNRAVSDTRRIAKDEDFNF